MLFNTWTFAVFLVVLLALYGLLQAAGRRWRWQNALLLVASYVFYGWWDWRFLGLIAASTVVDYVVARRLDALAEQAVGDVGEMSHEKGDAQPAIPPNIQRRRKAWLLVSLVFNLGLLGVFKYFDFFAESAAEALNTLGWSVEPWLLHVVLPVGISFYTFQTLGYSVDVYRRQLKACRSLPTFALYVSFFPQLVAGPIERATHLLPQFEKPRLIRWDDWVCGGWLVLFGLFKKVVIAETIAPLVEQVYGGVPGEQSGWAVVLATYLFAIQIYCDFSGYTDIARGVARWLGFDLMANFKLPYAATSPSDFWRRWHISLSTWLRDYLYIPLGGNRGGSWCVARNLMLTMLLGGLWHGAAWNFVLWGLFHGVLLVAFRFAGLERAKSKRAALAEQPNVQASNNDSQARSRLLGVAKKTLAVVLFFQVTAYGWLLFRATSFDQIATFTQSLLGLGHASMTEASVVQTIEMALVLLVYGGGLMGIDAWVRGVDDPRTGPGWQTLLGPLLVSLLVLLLLVASPRSAGSFLYFQF